MNLHSHIASLTRQLETARAELKAWEDWARRYHDLMGLDGKNCRADRLRDVISDEYRLFDEEVGPVREWFHDLFGTTDLVEGLEKAKEMFELRQWIAWRDMQGRKCWSSNVGPYELRLCSTEGGYNVELHSEDVIRSKPLARITGQSARAQALLLAVQWLNELKALGYLDERYSKGGGTP